MDYQDPFLGGNKPSFHEAPQGNAQSAQHTQSTQSEAPPPGVTSMPSLAAKPQKRGAKLVALCLSCALLGGLGGGAVTHFVGGGGNGTSIQNGERVSIDLKTVSTGERAQLTVPEIYANYAQSSVGISVDIVTKNTFGQTIKGAAAGSGFVISADGYIATNHHVVEGSRSIKVGFADGKSYDAKLIGSDADKDIAVIKIDAQGLTPVVLGDSSQMYVGETVATIGNPLGELTFSLSDGVISALERSITVEAGRSMNMIQTNCTINSGNSGGPLFNTYGEVIGIVTAKYSAQGNSLTGEASVEGLGFAIPISDVKDLLSEIISKGYVSKPFLGVGLNNVPDAVLSYGVPKGAALILVAPGLPAYEGGLREGDIVTEVDGKAVSSQDEFVALVDKASPGDSLTMKVYRSGETKEIKLTLGEKTSEGEAKYNEYSAAKEAQDQQSQNEGSAYNGMPYGGSQDSFLIP